MPLLILDRDGVLNERVDPCVATPAAWRALPGALDAVARLCHAGWHLVIAVNEPAVDRGLMTLEALHAIHNAMIAQIQEAGGSLDAVFEHPGLDPRHPWRWPNPGLFDCISARLRQPLTGVVAVGGSRAFVRAAAAAGATPVLISATEPASDEDSEVAHYPSLAAAVEVWLDTAGRETHA